MNAYKIEIAFDACGTEEAAQEFVEWLNAQGHDASVGNTTGSYVDGEWTLQDEKAREIMNALWDAFCK